MSPVSWRERAGRIDVRYPSRFAQRLLDDLSQQRRFPAPTRPDNFRQSPSRQPAAGQPFIERFHTCCQRADVGSCGSGKRKGEGEGKGKKIDERLWDHPVLSRSRPSRLPQKKGQ